ncbi:cytochrome P450 [Streptomyces sp. RKAG337]|uniref:cytochrome P450 n=1 Tax=Streptomyces sp. RKAG337 TaxID=2893404 RepID=UPI002034A2F7|nr:cytochrome P450 [Streptomyces sp. RKAG337]MCM2430395.1 cytochrome P450 [Streptomyces sp. RKAG337]
MTHTDATPSHGGPSAARAADPAYPAHRGCPMDPPALLGELRQQAPASRVTLWDGSRPWLVTRHAEARQVLRDERFSADSTRDGFPFVSPSATALRDSPPSFIRMDPPEHDRQRRMVTQEFMIKRVSRLGPRIERIVDDLLDDMIAAGPPADLVEAFALPLPSLVICELLGVPYADHGFFQDHSRVLLNQHTPVAEVRAARDELSGYLRELVGEKAVRPQDDLLSRLLADHTDHDELTMDDTVRMALLLLIAGHETTANMTALSVLDLLRHPRQWELLCADPGRVPGAVEELLRHQTIVHTGLPRVALADTEIGDVTVRAGEGVLVSLAAANRDERAFPEPDRLDVERPGRRHLAFGFGVHQCLGQPLARLELQIALTGIVRRLPGLRIGVPAGELSFRHTMAVFGLFHLPVVW